jgi:hypothetical protein
MGNSFQLSALSNSYGIGRPFALALTAASGLPRNIGWFERQTEG